MSKTTNKPLREAIQKILTEVILDSVEDTKTNEEIRTEYATLILKELEARLPEKVSRWSPSESTNQAKMSKWLKDDRFAMGYNQCLDDIKRVLKGDDV